MKIRSVTAVSAAAAITVAAGTVAAIAVTGDGAGKNAAQVAAAKPGKPAKRGDFNGDGHIDLAAASPDGTVAGKGSAGFVTVAYGSRSGPNPAKRQILTQASPGVPGDVRFQAYFGTAVAAADFDRDGYSDLALSTGRHARSIVIVYGGARGLTSRAVTLRAEGARSGMHHLLVGDFDGKGGLDLVASAGGTFWTYANVRGRPVPGVRTLVQRDADIENTASMTPVAADFNGDRVTDLALSVALWDEAVFTKPRAELRLGSARGLGAPRVIGKGWVGTRAAAGDVNGDGRADLVTERFSNYKTSSISVLHGTRTGLGAPKAVLKTTPGVDIALAVGDTNGDRRADVAFGDAEKNVGRASQGGLVRVLFGSKGGLTTKGAKLITQNTKGVPGNAENWDRFGQGLTFFDGNGDGKADLTIGSPQENESEGWIYFLPGSRTGVTVKGLRHFGPPALGVAKRDAALGGILAP